MHEDEGLTVTLSPVQMAAILHGKTISEGETMSNRLWGGLGVVSGVVEMFGAGVLCVVPEPTMLSKAGCVVVGSHSLDTITASFKQVITGRQTSTATAQLAEIAAGAARVGAVYSGRIRLLDHEGAKLGHTIARHIGKTPEQLKARFLEPRAPAASSSFFNVRQAELVISEVLTVKKISD